MRTGNLENVRRCLLVAPHAGSIQLKTKEILLTVAKLGKWAYYVFEGTVLDEEAAHGNNALPLSRMAQVSLLTELCSSANDEDTSARGDSSPRPLPCQF